MLTAATLLTDDELRRTMPLCSEAKRKLCLPYLQAAMLEFAITSLKRRAAFLPQLAHESAQLRYFEEIASGAAYEGRRDLGNTQPGDGRRYKGRGPIQLTGRANYRLFGQLLGVPLEADPELAATPEVGFRIAALYWQRHGLNQLADALTLTLNRRDEETTKEITRRINGGLNGFADRMIYFRRTVRILSEREDAVSPQNFAEIDGALEEAHEHAQGLRPDLKTTVIAKADDADLQLRAPAASFAPQSSPTDLLDKLPDVDASTVKDKAVAVFDHSKFKLTRVGGYFYAAFEAREFWKLALAALVVLLVAETLFHFRARLSPLARRLFGKVKLDQ
jgi:predicted chitinase